MVSGGATMKSGMAAAPKPRIFVDADVLVAGSASTSGANHVLLRLSEYTIVECLCSEQVIVEAERNLISKLPHALPLFRLLTRSALQVVADPGADQVAPWTGHADPKDLPILAAALAQGCHYLVTFNTRHYRPEATELVVLRPGALLPEIRARLADLVP